MKRRLPFFISTLVLCVSFVVLLSRVPARTPRSLVQTAAAELSSLLTPPAPEPEKASVDAQLLPPPSAEVEIVPVEAAQMPELRIAAIRNGVRYGWIQLPRGTRVELLRRDGDWLLIQYNETQLRVHRAVVQAGLIVPRVRGKLAAL